MNKKLLSYIMIFLLLFGIFQNNIFAYKKNKKYFRITAYYSPLPNQSHYIKGNYQAEIIMNGKGIRGASGKKVFSGMLAAPSKYPFGTKIKLKGLGIAEVADRGGAIVKAGKRNFKYDRIDIWCGYGEKGLQRAMFWGNRIIEGEIVSKNTKVSLDINKIPAPRWTIYHAIKNKDYLHKKYIKRKIYLSGKKINKKTDIFSQAIKDSNGVIELQKILKQMKLYSGKIDGQYIKIRKIILNFQLKNKIITKKTDIGAGNFGPKTRKVLKEKYNIFLKNKEIEKLKAIKLKKLKQKYTKIVNSIGKVKYGDISIEVRKLQKILKKLGYFKYKDTAIFGEKTKKSLIKYQLDKKLIKNKNIYGAGIFGPRTKKSIIEDLAKKSLEK